MAQSGEQDGSRGVESASPSIAAAFLVTFDNRKGSAVLSRRLLRRRAKVVQLHNRVAEVH